MIRVTDFEQLEDMTSRLLIEIVCPICGAVLISTMPNAQRVLVFGCSNCADIDTSMLLSFNNFSMSNTSPEEAIETPTG